MSALAVLEACGRGHGLRYPAVLEATAVGMARELVFCSTCGCGTVYFVVIWPGQSAKIMATGDTGLFQRYVRQDWPRSVHTDEHGGFPYRMPSPGEITVFLDSVNTAVIE